MTSRPLRAVPAVSKPHEGGAVEVAPGVLWVRMPLPLALDHINVWLLEDGDGWTVVDTGFANDRTRAAWEAVLEGVLGGRPITRVISTHYHPDHVGLAGWLVDRYGAEFASSLSEWLYARMLSLENGEAAERTAAGFYRWAGVPAELFAALVGCARSYKDCVGPVPTSLRRLRAGDELFIGGVLWRVLVGRGHSPEHVCLYAPERGILISGDQVLPHISPNVSVWPSEPDAEPLSDFLETLSALKLLPDRLLVLPSHKMPFVGLHRRLDELAAHHRLRLDEALMACAEPRTAFDVTVAMFGRGLDPHQMTFALGEAIAHLAHLVRHGRLERRRRGPDQPDLFLRRDPRT